MRSKHLVAFWNFECDGFFRKRLAKLLYDLWLNCDKRNNVWSHPVIIDCATMHVSQTGNPLQIDDWHVFYINNNLFRVQTCRTTKQILVYGNVNGLLPSHCPKLILVRWNRNTKQQKSHRTDRQYGWVMIMTHDGTFYFYHSSTHRNCFRNI